MSDTACYRVRNAEWQRIDISRIQEPKGDHELGKGILESNAELWTAVVSAFEYNWPSP